MVLVTVATQLARVVLVVAIVEVVVAEEEQAVAASPLVTVTGHALIQSMLSSFYYAYVIMTHNTAVET